MLELIDVGRTVGAETHIANVSLTLERGSLNVLLGPTLSGKTSLMRLMAGLDRPTSGRIVMDGRDVTGVPVAKRNIAMVYQQFINYPAMTVYENIASPLRIQGKSAAEIDTAVQKAAGLMKLTPYLQRTPLNLSGGQQQRTALARALVKNAEVVLLDEPLANLDYKLREELREELPRLFAETGAVFVYATTEPTEALLLGGNTATLSQGRITQFGRTPDIYRRPADLVTARTFSDPPLNVLELIKSGTRLSSASGLDVPVPERFHALADGPYKVGLRPHHLFLGSARGENVRLKGRVVISEVTGSESFVHADWDETRIVALVRGIHRVSPGDAVELGFDPADMLLFEPSGRAVASALPLAA
ncbi:MULTISPECIES: ABC transporter ATP-binding protein [unclassified Aureimonas]|uniref:ABC transporter ATP-binding protein n=1 Tax=unclassified Aureimonas TaxID=2615206 RepID=UPI0006F49EEE|nr:MULTISPECIES: ABC transporter ATP-binding protein [unclassified Aureimonas]KQT55345.1 ABC transporter ATP-binding protein [Aureimonas sp. Leaf427]KQT71136.1 ABC transporter ATP-binding protein [Aureimonas sp. Leaf460]